MKYGPKDPNRIKAYTVGIHWFGGSHVTQKFLNSKTLPKTGTIYEYLKSKSADIIISD